MHILAGSHLSASFEVIFWGTGYRRRQSIMKKLVIWN